MSLDPSASMSSNAALTIDLKKDVLANQLTGIPVCRADDVVDPMEDGVFGPWLERLFVDDTYVDGVPLLLDRA